MKYRKDIDGLRAVAVLSVIFFHSGVIAFSGGFVGVDVFFVISGYLITTLVYDDIKKGEFSFISFYKRRALRLLPALSITLFFVSLFGFVFLNNAEFSNLGKEIIFSSVGLANILFAQGSNYFVNDSVFNPLIHLWSLGVEEQFYFVWPLILFLLGRYNFRFLFFITLLFIFSSLYLSETATEMNPIKSYYYPHYRFFELLVGAIFAILASDRRFSYLNSNFVINELLSFFSFFAIVYFSLVFDENTLFPGFNALYPCIATGIFLFCSKSTKMGDILGNKLFVFIGLISYPLYLYHQPFLSVLYFFNIDMNPVNLAISTLLVCSPLAWLTYRYIERPLRQSSSFHKGKWPSSLTLVIFTIPIFVAIGVFINRTHGVPWRFSFLNSFAYEVSQNNVSSFHDNFQRGYSVRQESEGRVLFVGDSVLQNYVVPIVNALGIEQYDQVDVASRGGCVLLKGVSFLDSFSDVSCDDIRDKLYSSDKHYNLVVISQSWSLYDKNILNTIDDGSERYFLNKWNKLLSDTVEYFNNKADKVVIIGAHPFVAGAQAIEPNILLTKSKYLSEVQSLEVVNINYLIDSKVFFQSFVNDKTSILYPYDIWCGESGACKLHDEDWSFFVDTKHISYAGASFAEKRLNQERMLDLFKD